MEFGLELLWTARKANTTAQWAATDTSNARLNTAHSYALTKSRPRAASEHAPTPPPPPAVPPRPASKYFLLPPPGEIRHPAVPVGHQAHCLGKRTGEMFYRKWRVSAFSNCDSCYAEQLIWKKFLDTVVHGTRM